MPKDLEEQVEEGNEGFRGDWGFEGVAGMLLRLESSRLKLGVGVIMTSFTG